MDDRRRNDESIGRIAWKISKFDCTERNIPRQGQFIGACAQDLLSQLGG